MNGNWGTALMIDLPSGRVEKRLLPEAWYRDYSGGEGVAIRLFAELVDFDTPPLDPSQPLLAAVGPLTGTVAPSSGRTCFVFRSPASGALGISNVGGQLSPAIKKAGYDLIVFTGDQMDRRDSDAELFAAGFAGIDAPLGVWGVLGNHDHFIDPARSEWALRAAGIEPLVNRGVAFERDGASLALVGVDDLGATRERWPDFAVLGSFPTSFRICLCHQPQGWHQAAAAGAHLTLAGHTHGGQIALTGRTLNPARLSTRYIAGPYRRDEAFLYVSRGVGVGAVPVWLANTFASVLREREWAEEPHRVLLALRVALDGQDVETFIDHLVQLPPDALQQLLADASLGDCDDPRGCRRVALMVRTHQLLAQKYSLLADAVGAGVAKHLRLRPATRSGFAKALSTWQKQPVTDTRERLLDAALTVLEEYLDAYVKHCAPPRAISRVDVYGFWLLIELGKATIRKECTVNIPAMLTGVPVSRG